MYGIVARLRRAGVTEGDAHHGTILLSTISGLTEYTDEALLDSLICRFIDRADGHLFDILRIATELDKGSAWTIDSGLTSLRAYGEEDRLPRVDKRLVEL